MPKKGYDQGHGDAGSILPADEEQDAALPTAARTSRYVPSIEDLEELNRDIHDDAGLPGSFALDQRAPLLGVLDAARAVDTSLPKGVARAAALLAHGIAQSQSFRDGNRRTAFYATRVFLENHGLGYLSREEDDMLTRYLNQVVERQGRFGFPRPPGPNKFEQLFLRRLASRTPPAARQISPTEE